MIDHKEMLAYLFHLEKMGLLQKYYDPVTKEFRWELTPDGWEAREEMNDDSNN